MSSSSQDRRGHITIAGVRKSYTRGTEAVTVLSGVDLEIEAGRVVALMGPSGSGKSTLLNLVGGLDHADAGRITVDTTEITALHADELAAWRSRHVGFVFQSFNLIPVLTAQENVELPLLLQPLSKAQRKEQARYALEIVGLADRAGHRPGQLSGGQEQRVAIARAIASDPTLILADEPTGDLDRTNADAVLQMLRRLADELGKTVLMVTHDNAASAFAHQTVHLDKGALAGVAHA
ncbi:MAG: ABC transporter ATP-binding protein [Planctomycetes bacterium]|nr:ABC transporter ATP-binding protein [Planctomycetota bacterium]